MTKFRKYDHSVGFAEVALQTECGEITVEKVGVLYLGHQVDHWSVRCLQVTFVHVVQDAVDVVQAPDSNDLLDEVMNVHFGLPRHVKAAVVDH